MGKGEGAEPKAISGPPMASEPVPRLLTIGNVTAGASSILNAAGAGAVFVVVSIERGNGAELLMVGYFRPGTADQKFLELLINQYQDYRLLDARKVRARLAPQERAAMSMHLLLTQIDRSRHLESVVDEIVWRYSELVAWGEPSAAKLLANLLGVPIRTIHTRLRLARERGLLTSPGAGARLGATKAPTSKATRKSSSKATKPNK
jgi:hypothetical protein